jgi:hypothetical protein
MFGPGTYTKPTGHKLHLYKAEPNGGGAEVANPADDTAYVAQNITFAAEGVGGGAINNRVYNSAPVTFAAAALGAPYTVSHWAVKDGLGVMMATGAFPTPIPRVVGEPLALNIDAIYVEITRTV